MDSVAARTLLFVVASLFLFISQFPLVVQYPVVPKNITMGINSEVDMQPVHCNLLQWRQADFLE